MDMRRQPVRVHCVEVIIRVKMQLLSMVHKFIGVSYRNFPKFSDRQVWANSVDPDQTAPRGAV